MTDIDRQQREVLYLFERLGEPIYLPKGDAQYNIPEEYLPEDSKQTIGPRFSDRRSITSDSVPNTIVNVPDIKLPDLTRVKSVPRGSFFCMFHPGHRAAAYALVDIFLKIPTYNELIAISSLVRDQVNTSLYGYAWAAAIIRRQDTRGLRVPPVWEIFPGNFIENRLLAEGLRECNRRYQLNPEDRKPVVITRNFTATDRVVENKVSYFREDIGINSHHWHWHLVFPNDTTKRDRRGEMFFYLHQQMLIRYDVERMANNLLRTKSLHNLFEPIPEAYFPKITLSNGGLNWASRPSGMVLKDINIPDEGQNFGVEIQVNDMERWRTRILHAIHRGSVEDVNGKLVPLDEVTGIDVLGEMIEASEWSINKLLYGDLHNFGHFLLAFIHDPDRGHLENMGVMGDSVTAMRDPVFYRWHKFTDDLFQQYKATLQPYTKQQLTMPGIHLLKINVVGERGEKNVLQTGWQESLVELSRGLDFYSPLPLNASITHIQHEQFKYQITVENTTNQEKEIVLRIFMAPVNDEIGQPLRLREQRWLMMEMDKFVVKVKPGVHSVQRSSSQSSITIPFERTFRDLERPQPGNTVPGGSGIAPPGDDRFNYCGCGWPDHFLLPRGTTSGMPFVLFAMATNWEEDRVEGSVKDGSKACRNAASFCGVLDQRYPDKKPMGFPFDRPTARTMQLPQFLTPNMVTNNITIKFEDRVIQRRGM